MDGLRLFNSNNSEGRGSLSHCAKERALSFVSLFSGQVPAALSGEKIRGINGLPGFPEKRCERDPVR